MFTCMGFDIAYHNKNYSLYDAKRRILLLTYDTIRIS